MGAADVLWAEIGRRGGIASIPRAELEVLVEAIAAAIDRTAPEASAPAPADVSSASSEETPVWSGRPHVSAGPSAMNVTYELTTQRLRAVSGALRKSTEEIELVRVKDIKVTQGITDRGLGVGDVVIISTDPTRPHLTLRKVHSPNDLRETIRSAVQAEKARQGVHYRE